jgi:hypothetical protein
LTGSDNGDGVVLNANLKEGDDPGDGNEKESNDRHYLIFDIIAQINKAKGQRERESYLVLEDQLKS